MRCFLYHFYRRNPQWNAELKFWAITFRRRLALWAIISLQIEFITTWGRFLTARVTRGKVALTPSCLLSLFAASCRNGERTAPHAHQRWAGAAIQPNEHHTTGEGHRPAYYWIFDILKDDVLIKGTYLGPFKMIWWHRCLKFRIVAHLVKCIWECFAYTMEMFGRITLIRVWFCQNPLEKD